VPERGQPTTKIGRSEGGMIRAMLAAGMT
jgi:hypothetical protein